MGYVRPTIENGSTILDERFFNNIFDGIDESKNAKVVDLVMMMGQSNMAGRGVAEEAPVVPQGWGYEFRACTDPTKLYPIVEPFGKSENTTVSDGSKTGSMVSALAKAYYTYTKVPMVAVSCAKGGTTTEWWQPDGSALNEAIRRHNVAKEWLVNNGYTIRYDFMVWLQGCSDGDNKVTKDDYKANLTAIIEEMFAEAGIQKCFIARIANVNIASDANRYTPIIAAQTELCQEYDKAVLASTIAASFVKLGLMKDAYHYKQEGYNRLGHDVGKHIAFYVNSGVEPYMYDSESNDIYFSHCEDKPMASGLAE